MNPIFPIRPDLRLLLPYLAAMAIGLLLFAVIAEPGRAASVSGPPTDTILTAGDLGVSERFVNDATIVIGLDGTARTGADGLRSSIASLAMQYPDARFETTRTHSVNRMIIVDWNATVDGTVVLPGRTLVTIDDGGIAEIRFLNLNNVAPVGREPVIGMAHAAPEVTATSSRFVIVDGMGNAISPERSAFGSTDAESTS